MIPVTKVPSLIERIMEMVKAGDGFEDIAVKLKIPRATAYWYVFKKLRRRQQ